MFFKRLANAAPIAFPHAFRGQSNSAFTNFRIPFGAIAAISGGISYFYYDSPNLLQEKAKVSRNTQLFRFLFDRSAKLDLDVASCLIARFPLEQDAEGKTKYVIRPYTPISDPDSRGHFDLLIKVFPDGKLSQHFASLKLGDVVEVYPDGKMSQHFASLKPKTRRRSRSKRLKYLEEHLLETKPIEKLRYTPNKKKHIGMIAGGSSVTPMLQIIEAILRNPDDNTKISLLYANISPDDILLNKKLDVLEDSHPNLKIFYTVDNPSKKWRGGAGYISTDMAEKGLPGPSEDSLILVLKAQEGKVLGT